MFKSQRENKLVYKEKFYSLFNAKLLLLLTKDLLTHVNVVILAHEFTIVSHFISYYDLSRGGKMKR